jgi:hypothetical protein
MKLRVEFGRLLHTGLEFVGFLGFGGLVWALVEGPVDLAS